MHRPYDGLAARTKPPAGYVKREVFNTLSRLIWDIDIIPQLTRTDDLVYADLGRRVSDLRETERLGSAIFEDESIAAIVRVGMKTRKGLLRRADFFAL